MRYLSSRQPLVQSSARRACSRTRALSPSVRASSKLAIDPVLGHDRKRRQIVERDRFRLDAHSRSVKNGDWLIA